MTDRTAALADVAAPARIDVIGALKGAGVAAVVMLGLCVPIVLLRTEQNIANELILVPQGPLVAWLVGLTFAGVLMRNLVAEWQRVRKETGTSAAIAAGKPATAPVTIAAGPNAGARAFALAGLALLLVYPFLVLTLTGRAGAIKWIDNFGIQILIYVMLGWGLNIVVGLAGLLDLGYVAFYAVGAYTTALLSTKFGVSFWICLPLAGILAAFWGILLGFPVLRLRGDYLAIVTLAFGEIIRLVLINWVDVTGGYAGISSIPRPTFFGVPFNASDQGFAATFGLEFTPVHRTIFLYYLILALALLTNQVTMRLRRLPVGRAWEALREDEIACRSLGINTTNTKLTAFAIGAGFGGFAGAFFSARQAFISPESFVFMESAVILAIVVLGGMGSQIGVAIAAIVMIGGTEILRELDVLKNWFGPAFEPTHYRMLAFGLAMVVLMIWKPRGLISTRTPTAFLKERRAIAGSNVKEGHG
jgi:branched-chain amino acid transport system permease protein